MQVYWTSKFEASKTKQREHDSNRSETIGVCKENTII